MMVSIGCLLAVIPFGVFLGLGTLLEVTKSDSRLVIVFLLLTGVVSFLASMGGFALIQKNSCGSVKNLKQVTSNAGLAFGIQMVVATAVWLIPFLRGIVTGLFPPDTDPIMADAVGYAYFNFWAALYGIAIGGTLSGIC